MSFLLVSILSLVSLYYFGLGFTLCAIPRRYLSFTLLIAPVVGLSILTVASWYCYWLNAPGLSSYVWWLNVGILPTYWLARKRFGKESIASVVRLVATPDLAAVFLIAGLGFISIARPMLEAPLTLMSYGNNDPPHYMILSRLLSYPRSEWQIMQPHIGAKYQQEMDANWSGGPAFIAHIAATLGLMPHQLFNACILVFQFCSCLGVYLIAKALPLKKTASLFAVAMVSFSNVLYFVVYQGFLGQMSGIALTLGLIGAFTLPTEPSNQEAVRMSSIGALLVAGIWVCYPIMLPPMLGVAGLILAVRAFPAGGVRALGRAAIVPLAALLLGSLILPPRISTFVATMQMYKGVEAGWFVPLAWPHKILGLGSSLNDAQSMPWSLAWRDVVATIAPIVLICVASVGAIKRRSLTALSLALVTITLATFVIVLAINGQRDGQLGGYKAFKAATFFTPLFVLAFAACLDHVRGATLLAWLFCAVCVFKLSAVVDGMRHGPKLEIYFNELSSIEKLSTVASINLMSENLWATLSSTYFLVEKPLFFRYDGYFAATPTLDGEWSLFDVTQGVTSAPSFSPTQHWELQRRDTDFDIRAAKLVVRHDAGSACLTDLRLRVQPGTKVPDSISAFGRIYAANKDSVQAEFKGVLLQPGENAYQLDAPLSLSGIASFHIDPCSPVAQYRLGHDIRFAQGGDSRRYLVGGFGAEESWGTWTDGDVASLRLDLGKHVRGSLKLTARFVPFMEGKQLMTVTVLTSGKPCAVWRIDKGEFHELVARLPELPAEATVVQLDFVIDKPTRAADLGNSADKRVLGLGIMTLNISIAD